MIDRRRHTRRAPLLFTIATVAAAYSLAVPAGAVTVVSSSGLGLDVDLRVGTLAAVGIGPLAVASGSGAPAYSLSAPVASVDSVVDLSTFPLTAGLGVKTGLMLASASSPYPVTATGLGSSTIDDLSLSLTTKLPLSQTITLLSLGATTIDSMSSVTGFGVAGAMGSSTIEGLTLTILGTTIDTSLYAHAAPNTVVPITGLLGLSIILNAQTPTGDNVSSAGITTDAIDIRFTDFVLGTSLLNGTIVVAQSAAMITGVTPPPPPPTVPEPAIWLELIAGFSLIGAVRRHATRRVTGIAAA